MNPLRGLGDWDRASGSITSIARSCAEWHTAKSRVSGVRPLSGVSSTASTYSLRSIGRACI